ncbi:MAG: carboxylesterase family protein, partial [Gammaproteobacteria bacterium]|nr:carboxylesterase family protein [Gammaproteobacteria bacterium]
MIKSAIRIARILRVRRGWRPQGNYHGATGRFPGRHAPPPGREAGLVALVALVAVAAAFGKPVQLDSGLVQGEVVEGTTIQVFRGIPYAAPPVGDLRWREPATVASWEGVRAARQFSNICHQGPALAAMTQEALPTRSEDCLYLNVWTGAIGHEAKQPVMVWIHGGGLTLGWGHQRGYDGTHLASQGVVLVSINYRLGALGFLAHPLLTEEAGVSGNYGLKDQIAALEWVQRNIAAFGGDPDNVTIFGESAGGTSVHALIASSHAKGLVHRGIAQSPWVTGSNYALLDEALPTVGSASETGRQWVDTHFESIDSAAKLRGLSAEDLFTAQEAGYAVAVTIDGDFMPDHAVNVYARGEQLDVPVIADTNTDEGTIFMNLLPFNTPEAFRAAMQEGFGDHAATILELYPVTDLGSLFGAKNQLITDTWFLQNTRNMLAGMANVSSKGWQYHFSRRAPQAPMLGAFHGMEIGYAFGNLQADAATEDRALSEAMTRYWVQFATTGDPNVDGLPAWPAYDPETDQHLELGDEIGVGAGYRKDALDTLNAIWAAR